LEFAEKVHNVSFPQHLRDRSWAESFCNGITDVETENELLKKQLIWHRLEKAISAMSTALKNSSSTMKRHLEKVELEETKAAKKARETDEKQKLSTQKQELSARAKKLTSAGPVLPQFFSLAKNLFEKFPEVEGSGDGLPANFDTARPCVVLIPRLLEEYLTKPIMQQVLTSFGGRYKKLTGYKEEGKVSNTLVVKQGKEETEAFFAKLCKPLATQPMSLAKISAAWNTTSWLWGYKPVEFATAACTPSGAAMFKVAVLGDVDTFIVPCVLLSAAMKTCGIECRGIDQMCKTMKEMDLVTFKKLSEAGLKIFYRCISKETCFFVPSGCIVMEAAGDSSLIYGIRKSLFFNTDASRASLSLHLDLVKQAGHDAGKTAQVLELFSA